jgi:hypothetical protein
MGIRVYPVAVVLHKRQHTSHTTLKQNTAHKTTQTIKDTLHTMNTMQIQLKLQQSAGAMQV